MTPRKSARKSIFPWFETQWKPFFELGEVSRLRRGKSAAKNGDVAKISYKADAIEGRVKSSNRSAHPYHVHIPLVSNWGPYLHDIALWVSRRPDWLAEVLADSYPEELISFCIQAGLRLFPDEETAQRMVRLSTCTCTDEVSPCMHVVAVQYQVIQNITNEPRSLFETVGIDIRKLLDEAHEQSVSHVGRSGHQAMPEGNPAYLFGQWPEEEFLSSTNIHHLAPSAESEAIVSTNQVLPQLDAEKLRHLHW